MVNEHFNRCNGPFQVMMSLFEHLKDCKKFFIMYVVVQFSRAECPGVEDNSEYLPQCVWI